MHVDRLSATMRSVAAQPLEGQTTRFDTCEWYRKMEGHHCIVGMQSPVLDPLRRTALLKQLIIGWRLASVKVVA